MTVVNAVEVVTPSTPSLKPSNGETLISLVLDETGSMMSCLDSTISSVNDYLGSQQSAEGVCKVNLFTFSEKTSYGYARTRTLGATPVEKTELANQNFRPVFENTDVKEVSFLTRENFRPNGNTNLYDAIGNSIRRVEDQLSGLESVPNVLIVIVTDGGENASREFNLSAVQTLVKDKESQGWTFIYLGANQDAWKVASSFGLSKGQAMTYSTDAMGSTMATLSDATTSYRGLRSSNASLNSTVERSFFKDPEA